MQSGRIGLSQNFGNPFAPSPKVSVGKEAKLKLEERGSDKLYAVCPIPAYPGPAVQAVADSSRYFVIKVTEEGKAAHLGLGFADRADSFDLNTALHDHFKSVQVRTQESETIEFQSLRNAVRRRYLPLSDCVMRTLKFDSFQLWNALETRRY